MKVKISQKGIRRFTAFILFGFMVWQVFVHLTYLFRNTDFDSRQHILAYYNERPNSLDVVLVGGSNVHRYWDAMLAWNQYGMATYGYSAGSMSAYTYLPAIKEVERSQAPIVTIVDVRRFLSEYPDDNIQTIDYRNMIDSMDYDLNRLLAEKYVCDLNRGGVIDAISCYIDIIQYHSNRNALNDQGHWLLINNKIDLRKQTSNLYKGTLYETIHNFLKRPENRSEQTCELPEKAETAYRNMIEYCISRKINLLLIESPFEVSEQESMELNTMAKIAKEYHVEFLDLNDFYDEMGLDFSTDFYNRDHTNILGMEKYTNFLAGYLQKRYDLPDHRGDEMYSEWDELYKDYEGKRDDAIELVWQRIEDKKQAIKIEEELRLTDDAYVWLSSADNLNMTVLFMKSGASSGTISVVGASFLEKYGIPPEIMAGSQDYYGVYCERKVSQSDNQGSYSQIIKAGDRVLEYKIGLDNEPYIMIGDQDYYVENDGIQMVVIDNNTLEVADSIVLKLNSSSELNIEHIKRENSFPRVLPLYIKS